MDSELIDLLAWIKIELESKKPDLCEIKTALEKALLEALRLVHSR